MTLLEKAKRLKNVGTTFKRKTVKARERNRDRRSVRRDIKRKEELRCG